MILDINRGIHDQQLYNLPTANEFATVFVGENSEVPTYQHIAIHPRGQDPQTISILYPHCDSMTYSLLFPRGDKGWYSELEKIDQSRNRKRVSMLQFYSYRLAIRQNFSAIHYEGKLFQQYIVDAYVKTEQNRPAFHRQNQKTLRGHDCANIKLQRSIQKGAAVAQETLELDEIKAHLDTRYVSTPEAAWRLFEFALHDKSHGVIRLAVHLPNQ
ncbi:unnamed protein product [Rotaria sordida]|uniref:Helitron helicase-like domain-containing protein n=1 Tax=Rotaria sordida TaxID=392033 RepID=A0A814T1J2_9BILA|nr:unnamed protein product [Rotaria sordida]CAF1395123.1 unnamed protein product [Rotaria sordida]